MVAKAERFLVGEYPRSATEREWELFVREQEADPLRHVGSVTAPTAEIAHEQASKLFGWYATDIWVCPADEMHRFATHDLDADAEPATSDSGDEPRQREWS